MADDETSSDSYGIIILVYVCCGLIILWLVWAITQFSVLPAFIVAQNRNDVLIPMCPVAISSSVGLSYLIPVVLLLAPIVLLLAPRRITLGLSQNIWVRILCYLWIKIG